MVNPLNDLARQAKARASVLEAIARLPHGQSVHLLRQIADEVASMYQQVPESVAAKPTAEPREVPAPVDPPRARDGRKYPVRVFQPGERRDRVLAMIEANPEGVMSAEIIAAFNGTFNREERGRVYSMLHVMTHKYKTLEQDQQTKRYRLRAS